MPIEVVELHHHGIRIAPSWEDADRGLRFYRDVLGLTADVGRPEIGGLPGYWMNVGDTTQIHLMGASGMSSLAQGPDKDPTRPHVALAVTDVGEAKRELDRQGVPYFTTRDLVGQQIEQIFLYDPFGNMIELHQVGTCRCARRGAVGAGAMS